MIKKSLNISIKKEIKNDENVSNFDLKKTKIVNEKCTTILKDYT